MRGKAVFSPSKYKFKQIYTKPESWGSVTTSTPKKQGYHNPGEEGPITKEKNDPIVALSRPPRLPPVLGPLVALSLLDVWSSNDSKDD